MAIDIGISAEDRKSIVEGSLACFQILMCFI